MDEQSKFVLVRNGHPEAGANSCGVDYEEFWAEELKADLHPERDKDYINFLDTAKPGEYIFRKQAVIVFRTK